MEDDLGQIGALIGSCNGVRAQAVLSAAPEDPDRRPMALVVTHDHPLNRVRIAEEAILEDWALLFNAVHGEAEEEGSGNLSETGWKKSDTGKHFTESELTDWAKSIAAVVAAWARGKPLRILEIGCGTGLSLFELAPFAEHYVATDPSSSAIRRLANHVSALGLCNVHLETATAESAPFDRGPYDLILLTSVVQYLPSFDYLNRILSLSLEAARQGGALIIGDVRDFDLRAPFHWSMTAKELNGSREAASKILAQRCANDREMCLSVRFFETWAASEPRVSTVDIVPHVSSYSNELTKYRFNIVARVDADVEDRIDLEGLEWTAISLKGSLKELERIAEQQDIFIRNIPRFGVPEDLQEWRQVVGCCLGQQTECAQTAEVTPVDIVAVARNSGSHAYFRYGSEGRFDTIIRKSLSGFRWPEDGEWSPAIPQLPLGIDPSVEELNGEMRRRISHRVREDMGGTRLRICFVSELPEPSKLDRDDSALCTYLSHLASAGLLQ